MPQLHESGRGDQHLVQYLLGLLSPEETERLDEASVADDDVAARLRTVEHDLVDAYVRGALTGETLRRFEAHYLLSPHRREAVTFARRFVPIVDRAASLSTSDTRRSISWGPVVLAVAAALLLVTSSALLFQTVRLRRGLNVAQSERVALDRHARELEQQVADLRAATATAREPERARETVPAVRPPSAIALLLLPQTRSVGPIPSLTIAPGADRVGFELRLQSNDFPRYRVGLRDPAVNQIVWRSGWIVPTPSDGQASVRVAIPAGVLKPQHYSLDLTGRDAAGGPEVAGSYVFEITPK